MSRSWKKAITKDKGLKDIYHKKVRRKTKQFVNRFLEEDDINESDIPISKEIMNDYDYSDYTIDYEHDKSSNYFWYNDKKGTEEHEKWVKKMKRK